jgi:hypothetical protein
VQSNRCIESIFAGAGMKLNVGGTDRIVRIVAGLGLIGLTLTGNIGVWGWLGVIPLATGAIGWCPPYAIFGFNTCSMK